MGEKNTKASVEDILSGASERLKRVTENLRKLREAGQDDFHAGRADMPTGPPAPAPAGGQAVCLDRWAETLRDFGSELDALNSGTEAEFLYLGASLQEFYRRARKASEISAFVAHAISDKEVEKTIDSLSGLLEKIRDGLAQSNAGTGALVGRLREVQAVVAAVQGRVAPGSEAYAKVAVVGARVGDAVETVLRLISRHRQKEGAVIENAALGLEVLSEKHDMAAEAMQEVSSLSAKITRAMGEVVESLQFHDITRQRIEHVRADIGSLAGRLLAMPGAGRELPDPVPPEFAEMVSAAGEACEFEAEQLARSRDELCYAVDVIQDNLRNLATSTAAVSEEISILAKGDSANARSFLTGLGGWLSSATSAFPAFIEECEASKKAAAAAHDAAETARELCRLLGQGGEDGGRGKSPAALVLAALAALDETLDKEGVRASGEGAVDFKGMGDELSSMLNSLRCLNGKVLYSLGLIDEAGRTLSDDIEKAVKAIGVHERFKGVADSVGAGLLDMAAKARSATRGEGYPAGQARLRMVSSQENRGIWRPGLAQGLSGGVSGEHAEGDFGENVELF